MAEKGGGPLVVTPQRTRREALGAAGCVLRRGWSQFPGDGGPSLRSPAHWLLGTDGQVEIEDRTKGTMKETEIKRLLSANVICIFSIIVATVIPSLFLENFSILGTHLTWLSICSASVGTVNIVLYFILKPNPSNRRTSLAHKVARFLRCCVYFFMSCILFHGIIVLYGAPLIESVLETFLFAVLLSTFTTLHCLCLLGPNIHMWLRVFSKNGAMSIWDSSLQITAMCSVVGAWLGAFPIPLDWDRPWQVWPISCSLGATFGYVAGLLIAPLWIYWNRKQLTYKSR